MAVQRIRDIANNLLDRYHEESSPRSVLIKSILDEVITLKRYEWSERDFELIFSSDSEMDFLSVNAAHIETSRILSNLINNAIEACDHYAKIQISINKKDTFIDVFITDNGRGIPAENIEKHLRGESTKHAGLGIGLSSAKQYMESIGGELFVNSQLDVGTTIILRFIASE